MIRPGAIVLILLLSTALPAQAQPAAPSSFIGRPVYSEPGAGLQLPPNCVIEPTWRTRVGASDHELWIVVCDGVARAWLMRRALVEALSANQSRLRFQVVDERHLPGEAAGESVSVQCTGRDDGETGYLVIGAKWRPTNNELRLNGAQAGLRADPISQKFKPAALSELECIRYPEREAMMRRLQQGKR